MSNAIKATVSLQPGPDGTVLLRDSFRAAKRARAAAAVPKAKTPAWVLANVHVWHPDTGEFRTGGLFDLLIIGDMVEDIFLPGAWRQHIKLNHQPVAAVVDCGGAWLLPGFCDAHVHCTAVTADLAGLQSLPESLVTAGAAEILGGMLKRGFTTVRDAGGADFGLAQAVEEGSILGPRILFTGHALSQTGGHGDFRGKGEDCCACGAALRGIGRVCDGVGECRRAARDELRKGAHCIKVMASGGVASPTDRLTNTQFSLEELRAIVEEAEAAGTYVCAHAYKPSAIKRALECGVRSIEHGNWLDPETADMMVSKGAFLVPTTVTYAALKRDGVRAGMPPELVAKVADAVEQGIAAMRLAQAKGVTMCFGSDLLGALHEHQSEEFELRSQAGIQPSQLIAHATKNCSRLFNMPELGSIKAWSKADLVLFSGPDPSKDASVLANPAKHVRLVVKDGLVAVAPGGAEAAAFDAANAAVTAALQRATAAAAEEATKR